MAFLALWFSLWELRDRRVDAWLMMSSPWPTLVITLGYINSVTHLGPSLMKSRQPLNVKGFMQVYNLLQVAISSYIAYEACAAGWLTSYNWVCDNVDDSPDPAGEGLRMARVTWMYYMSKFLEFFDTFFFIARKKFSHVSILQVTHHSIMPIFGYAMTRWLPGGHETFGGLMNSLVHIVMYTYYFLAALGPEVQRYLWWKKYLTTFQMVQFSLIFLKSLIIILGIRECGYPWQFSLVSASIMATFFGLFYNFYRQEYLYKRKQM